MKYLLLIAFVLFSLRRLTTYLHIFQQEEYQPVRFLHWAWASRSLDKRASIAILLFGLLEFTITLSPALSAGFVICILLAIAYYEKDPRKASKKKLVMTGRATRIYWVAFVILIGLAVLYTLPGVPTIAWVIPVQFVPLTLVLANLALSPYERKVQEGFWNEAHEKLGKLKPVVIGITGSYGKTSTKHILGHILELQAPTLITPGSVNTPMGIARIIRERLGAHHRFFVCEMGAYGPGSIARLCRLAPPDMAVLTAIGMAHYERFKSLGTVAKAKLELAESVASRQGVAIFHEQVLDLEDPRAFQGRYRDKVILVGGGVDATFRMRQPEQTGDGIRVSVTWQEREYLLQAPLYGEHHIGNMAVAFAAACTLGVPAADAVTALRSVPQIAHRLEVKAGTNGSRLIDDAYNSNPVGFTSALHLLSQLQENGGRRILVTPGMVELGTAHESEHERIGTAAGQHVDVLIAVLPVRISSFVSAFRLANPQGEVVSCASFQEAQLWMNAQVTGTDVVLLENDLPDVYERKLSL